MAEINTSGGDHGKKGKHKPKAKKVTVRVDMTPMVDLGFLLINFFMLTTSIIKPQTMEISVPSKEKSDNPPPIKNSLAITIIPGKDNTVYYYFGAPQNGKDPDIIKTDYSKNGLRKMLLDRNANVIAKVAELKKKNEAKQMNDSIYKKEAMRARADMNAPMVIIKATNSSTYSNLVDVLDEMQICNIGRYAIVDITAYDLKLVKDKGEALDAAETEQVNKL
jgi:biopolymer transport protein ExbD